MTDLWPNIVFLLSTTFMVDAGAFDHWAYGCDQSGECTALTALPVAGETGGERLPLVLRVTSYAAPTGGGKIELVDMAADAGREGTSTGHAVPRSISVRYWGNEQEVLAAPDFTFSARDGGEFYRLPTDRVPHFIQQLKTRRILSLRADGGRTGIKDLGWINALKNDRDAPPFDLVLTMWDIEREVVGTPHAMAPNIYDGPDLPAPKLAQPERVVRLGFVSLEISDNPEPPFPDIHGCERDVAAPAAGYRLGAETKLWRVACKGAGRNDLSVWFIDRGDGPSLLELPDATGPVLPAAQADPRAGVIRSLDSGGPNQDCGVIRYWGWTGEKSGFRPIERLEMPFCFGLPERHWLRTLRTEYFGFEHSEE